MSARQIGSEIQLSIQSPVDLVFSVAAAASYQLEGESLSVAVDGTPVAVSELVDPLGTRLHRVQAPVGLLTLSYAATVPGPAEPLGVQPLDDVEFLRPSRYCDSDRLVQVARTNIGDLTGLELVRAVRRWALGNITYAPGNSSSAHGALDTYVSRVGVCRDTSHLVIAFLRGLGLPARLVSAYSPGLVPMDFHAVAEVLVDGHWYVVDGTGLAPRPGLVRIATGRDAADTAFLTVQSGAADLVSLSVTASMDELPYDDGEQLVRIS